jgi:hypothetical protein
LTRYRKGRRRRRLRTRSRSSARCSSRGAWWR